MQVAEPTVQVSFRRSLCLTYFFQVLAASAAYQSRNRASVWIQFACSACSRQRRLRGDGRQNARGGKLCAAQDASP